MAPQVSILVPVYNVERHIAKCCHSLFGQTYDNIEYVFVDDCTPDKSIEVVRRVLGQYPSRKDAVKIYRNERNSGLAVTRSVALSKATGVFVMHVDSDDWITPDAVEKAVRVATEQRSDYVCFGCSMVYPRKIRNCPHPLFEDKRSYVQAVLARRIIVSIWGKLVKRSLYGKQDFWWTPGLNFGEDYSVLARLAYNAERPAFIPDCLYAYSQLNEASIVRKFKYDSVRQLVRAEAINHTFFASCPDASDYEQSLRQGRASVKEYAVEGVFGDKSLWNKREEACALYPGETDASALPVWGHLLLSMADKKMFVALRVIVLLRGMAARIVKSIFWK